MINVKKIVAVTLAAAMCMGLSMTTFASTNPSRPGTDSGSANNALQLDGFENLNRSPVLLDETRPQVQPDGSDGDVYYQNKRGTQVKPTNGDGEVNEGLTLKQGGILKNSKSWNSVNSANEIADILSENGLSVPAGTDIIAIASGVVNGLSDEEDNVLTFTLAPTDFSTDAYDTTKYHAGDEVWAMFETGENTGVWEMRSGKVNGDGQVDFTVDHKGGFILLKTMKNGRIVAVEKKSDGTTSNPVVVDPNAPTQNPGTSTTPSGNQGTSTTPSAGQTSNGTTSLGTSPKTGEF